MQHELKIEENYLDNLLSGKKKCEIRYNDRDYQLDDILLFKKYGFQKVKEHFFRVTHIHSGLGLNDGYIIMSVVEIKDK